MTETRFYNRDRSEYLILVTAPDGLTGKPETYFLRCRHDDLSDLEHDVVDLYVVDPAELLDAAQDAADMEPDDGTDTAVDRIRDREVGL